MKAGVILGFRNWHLEHLRRCLLSWQQQGWSPIVVDLGSSNETWAVVERLCDMYHATGIRFPQPQWSRSIALNHGAFGCSDCDWYVFTDADMIVPPGWRELVTAAIESGVPRTTCWLTRSRDLSKEATAQLHDQDLEDATRLHILSTPHSAVGQGAAMVIPGEWFRDVGGFDEAYAIWGCEETDLIMRASWDGLSVHWIPSASAIHQWHDRTWPTPEQFRRVQQNRAYLALQFILRQSRRTSSMILPDGPDDQLALMANAGVYFATEFAKTILP